jgi:transposase
VKQNKYRVNYGTEKRNVQLKIDEMFAEKMIPADDSVRLLDEMMEEMDYTPLMRAYKRTGRRPATNPVTMLKIVVYAIMQGIFSSRAIATACRRDINFIWLLNGEEAPNHSEIARFRSKRVTECGEELFYQLVEKLSSHGEIKYEHLFVDGTKIEANANKYSFVWKKSTTKYETRLHGKLENLIPEMCSKYGILAETPEDALHDLEQKVTVPFVHGRGKRKSELQKDIELLQGMLNRNRKYAVYQEKFQGRNSFSKTDPDATFMHMKEDHMRNAQLKPGYNIQFGVEGEYITGVLVSSERSDQLTLIPLLESMENHLEKSYADVTADAGYESEENYTYFEGKTTECYIKPQNYERSKTKKYKSNLALREMEARKKARVVLSARLPITSARAAKAASTKRSGPVRRTRGQQVSKTFIEQRKQSLERITSEKGILLRMNRSIQS